MVINWNNSTIFSRRIVCKFSHKSQFLGLMLCLFSGPLFAQQSKEEHESHHPDVYQQQEPSTQSSDTPISVGAKKGDGMAAGKTKGGGPASDKGPGMGPGMVEGMGKMMEKMGAPKPKDLYPSLMRLSQLPAEKEQEVLDKAVARMQTGNQLMISGFTSLADADRRQDFSQMQSSVATIEQGLSQYDSGLAAKRAIAEGQEPRRVALQWFKSQMNLLPTTSEKEQILIFGMAPLHTGVMFILLLFSAVMIWMYAFKMRRAAALLKELESGSTPSPIETVDLPANLTEKTTPQPNNIAFPEAPSSVPSQSQTSLTKVTVFKGKMRVVGIFNETHDVKTFRFAPIGAGALPFDYQPGQFVTFNLDIPKQPKTTKRSYTIASSPTQRDYFEVTIKREEKGLVSRFMHDDVALGDELDIKAPNGKFYFNGENENSVVLVSGGVGITPMMSAVRYLTDRCWDGNIYFLFCTRSSNDFIFERELQQLQARHKNLHVLVSMTRAEGTSWMGPQGRFTPQLVNDFIPDIELKTAHICGPPAMMDATVNMLIDLGMPSERVKTEAFGGAPPKEKEDIPKKKQQVQLKQVDTSVLTGFEVSFTQSNKKAIAHSDETILDIADNLDVEIDNSCRSGSCGSCIVKLVSGEVEMEVDDALEEDEKQQGYILACQSIPKTPVEIEA
jgi:ferredoxin-NADP reductase